MLRKSWGSSLAEVAVVSIAVVPLVLIMVDLIILTTALATNTSLCREAARTAAASNPKDANEKAAKIVAAANLRHGGMISGFELSEVSSTISPEDLQALGPFGGAIQGTITVKTAVVIQPLIIKWLWLSGSPLKFQAQQTFPYTYQMPNEVSADSLK